MKGFTLVGSILGMTEALSGIKGLVRELILYTAILVLQCTFNSFLSWSTQLMVIVYFRKIKKGSYNVYNEMLAYYKNAGTRRAGALH